MNIDIERLKELIQSEDSDLWDYKEELIALFDEAIARQSVKSEEVAEAIEWQVSLKDYHQNKWEKAEPEWQQEPGAQAQHNEMIKAIDLAIAALQAYQPTTRKDRTVEEVAISKTETTSEPCEYCRKPIYLKWNVSFIDGYYKLNDDCNYCPNCGRKLN